MEKETKSAVKPAVKFDKIQLWLKTVKKQSFPKLLNGGALIIKENILLIWLRNQNNKLAFYHLNVSTNNIEEKFTMNANECDEFDLNFLHREAIYFSNRLHFLKNAHPSENQHMLIADLSLRKLLPIVNDDTRPSTFRINYSANLYIFKIFIFGGLNQNMELLDILDTYDITTYKWETIKTKGKSPDPRHSHNGIVIEHNLYIFGGTKSKDLFHREGNFDDLYILDLRNYSWTPVKMFGNIPKAMSYNFHFKVSERKLMLLSAPNSENNEIVVSQLDLVNFEWEDVLLISKKPEFRYGAAFCYDEKTQTGYFYGGFYYNKTEPNAIGNELDRFKISDKSSAHLLENIEMLGNEKLSVQNLNKIVDELTEDNKDLNEKDDMLSKDEDEELTFEEILEREKKLQEEEMNTKTDAKKPSKKKKAKKSKSKK